MSAAGVVVWGASGFVGGTVVDALCAAGVVNPVLAGRNEGALRAVAARAGLPPDCVAVVEPDDATSLARALERGRVVIACAGPFARIGEPVVAACATHGIDYVDCAIEPDFVRMIARRYHETARANDAALVPACGFDATLVDAALARAADGIEGPLDVTVAYAFTNFAASNGMRATALEMSARTGLAIEGGALRDEPQAARVETISFRPPFATSPAFSFGDAAIAIAHRRTTIRSMRAFVAAKRAGWIASATRAMPVVSRMAFPLAKQFFERPGARGPGPVQCAATRFQVVVDVRASDGHTRRRITLSGGDVVKLDAMLLVEAATTLLARGRSHARGVRAPSECIAPARVFDLVRGTDGGSLHSEEWS